MILKRMKRRHTRADAVRFCTEARRLRPDMVFGADLIAGFPTETDAMFAGSMRLVEDCGLTFLHVFPFSPRKGTPAARMPQVPRAAAKERAAALRHAGETALALHLHGQVGSQVELLIERERIGRTPQFAELELDTPAAPGTLVPVRVTGSTGKRLRGVALATMCAA
jgi:threonylcarbamoyladenosine tRNA methylthiotransferase MtaB